MATNYDEYAHIKLYLSDILKELDEAREDLTRGLLRINLDATEESIKHQLGVIQGFARATEKLKATFGAL